MSITTYAELQTSVANWLHRGDLTAIIPDLILLGENRIFRTLRIRDMETALNSTISSGVIAIPSSYLDLKFAYVDGSPTQVLQRVSAHAIYSKYPTRTTDGKPVMIAREGTNFIFGPYPDSGYTIKGIYYAKPTSIQTSTNAVFLANPELYLFAALCEAAPYILDDPRLPVWEGKLKAVMNDLTAQDSNEYSSGGGLMVSAA